MGNDEKEATKPPTRKKKQVEASVAPTIEVGEELLSVAVELIKMECKKYPEAGCTSKRLRMELLNHGRTPDEVNALAWKALTFKIDSDDRVYTENNKYFYKFAKSGNETQTDFEEEKLGETLLKISQTGKLPKDFSLVEFETEKGIVELIKTLKTSKNAALGDKSPTGLKTFFAVIALIQTGTSPATNQFDSAKEEIVKLAQSQRDLIASKIDNVVSGLVPGANLNEAISLLSFLHDNGFTASFSTKAQLIRKIVVESKDRDFKPSRELLGHLRTNFIGWEFPDRSEIIRSIIRARQTDLLEVSMFTNIRLAQMLELLESQLITDLANAGKLKPMVEDHFNQLALDISSTNEALDLLKFATRWSGIIWPSTISALMRLILVSNDDFKDFASSFSNQTKIRHLEVLNSEMEARLFEANKIQITQTERVKELESLLASSNARLDNSRSTSDAEVEAIKTNAQMNAFKSLARLCSTILETPGVPIELLEKVISSNLSRLGISQISISDSGVVFNPALHSAPDGGLNVGDPVLVVGAGYYLDAADGPIPLVKALVAKQ